jgi:hypothetical protein
VHAWGLAASALLSRPWQWHQPLDADPLPLDIYTNHRLFGHSCSWVGQQLALSLLCSYVQATTRRRAASWGSARPSLSSSSPRTRCSRSSRPAPRTNNRSDDNDDDDRAHRIVINRIHVTTYVAHDALMDRCAAKWTSGNGYIRLTACLRSTYVVGVHLRDDVLDVPAVQEPLLLERLLQLLLGNAPDDKPRD